LIRQRAADNLAALFARVGRIEAALGTLYQLHRCEATNSDPCAVCDMHSELQHG
jgi:hypothetical protein